MRKIILAALLLCSLVCASCEFSMKEPADGAVHYVIIGQNYNWDSGGHLSSCINDAYAMKQLIEHYYPSTATDKLSSFIIDEPASGTYKETYYRFNHALNLLEEGDEENHIDSAGDNDMTIIYYSGHGSESSVIGEAGAYYMLSEWKSADDFDTKDMAPAKLLRYAKKIPGETVIISDCCFSGGIASWYGNTADLNVMGSNIWAAALSDARYPTTSIHVLSAATNAQTSKESPEYNHGAFTYYFLVGSGATAETAKKANIKDSGLAFTSAPASDKGKIMIDSIFSCVKKHVPSSFNQNVTSAGNPDDIALF
jgi:hypothetical protein